MEDAKRPRTTAQDFVLLFTDVPHFITPNSKDKGKNEVDAMSIWGPCECPCHSLSLLRTLFTESAPSLNFSLPREPSELRATPPGGSLLLSA